MKDNDDEQATLSDLTEMMGKLCPEPGMAYSNVWMKKKLQEYFGDDVIIGNADGKSDVVTFVTTAKKILAEFYETVDSTSDDIEKQKLRIFFLFKRIYLQHLGQNNYNNIEMKITRAIKQDWTLTRLIIYLSTPAHVTKRIK